MKFRMVLCEDREEEVVVYARACSALTDAIEALVVAEGGILYGKKGSTVARLSLAEIEGFCIDGGHLIALVGTERWQLRERLRALENRLPLDFVRIHQSCIINLKKVVRFEASIGGAMRVILENGYSDYVSRRQLKTVKERVRSLL